MPAEQRNSWKSANGRTHFKRTGFVYSDNTSCALLDHCPASVTIQDRNPAVLGGARGTRFRGEPSKAGQDLGILANRTNLRLIADRDSNGWIQVELDGTISQGPASNPEIRIPRDFPGRYMFHEHLKTISRRTGYTDASTSGNRSLLEPG